MVCLYLLCGLSYVGIVVELGFKESMVKIYCNCVFVCLDIYFCS